MKRYIYILLIGILFLGSLGSFIFTWPTSVVKAASCPNNANPPYPACYMQAINTDVSVTISDGQKITNFSGYKVIQNGSNYYLTGSNGNVVGQLPGSLTINIHGLKSGVNLDTWAKDSSGTYKSTGGNQSYGPLINNSTHTLVYMAFTPGILDPAYHHNYGSNPENFKICASGSSFSSGSNCIENTLSAINSNSSYLTIPETITGNLKVSGTLNKSYNYEDSNGSLVICQSNNPNDQTCDTTFGQSQTDPNAFACNQLYCPGLSSQDTITVGTECGTATLASYGTSQESGPPQQTSITIHNLSVLQNNNYGMNCSTSSQPNLLNSTSSAAVAQTNGTGTTSGASSTTTSCQSSGGPFAWLICTGAQYMADAEKNIENFIDGMLQIQPFNFSASQACAQNSSGCSATDSYSAKVYGVWNNFRIYGNIVLVIALLVIVFGEVLGGGLIDAYTAKKVLPRILVAAILLNLSIYLVAIMMDITNVVGGGIQSLIEAPFHITNDAFSVKVGGGTGLALTATLLAGSLYAGIALGATAIVMIVIGMGLIAAIGIFVTIMLRQIIIVLLLMTAPVAFALYCLPNTEQYFKKWWSLLIKTLLVYPIIGVVFAASNIAGVVFSNMGISTTNNLLAQSFAVVAMIIPLFLIPFAFKMSGGLIGQIAGAVSNLSKTARTPITNFAKKRAQDRWTRAQSNELWNKNRSGLGGAIAKRANTLAGWASSPGANLAYLGYKKNVPGLSGAGGKVAAKIHHAQMEQTANLVKEMNDTGMFNDKAYRALSGAYGEWNSRGLKAMETLRDPNASEEDKENAKRAMAVRQGLIDAKFMDQNGKTLRTVSSATDVDQMASILEKGGSTERIGANALRGYKGRLASLYSDPEMGKASVQGASIMGLSSHGFASGQDLANVGEQLSEHGKEIDFAQSIVSRAQVMGQQQRPDIKAGYGVDVVNGHFISGIDETGGSRALALIKTLSSHDLAVAKGGAIEALRPAINQTLDKNDGESQAVKDQLFQWAGPYSQASVDVKAKALEIIDQRSGPKVPRLDKNGNQVVDSQGNPVMAYREGTMGAEFEQTLRIGRSPEEIEAMRRAGVDPDQAAGTEQDQH